MDDTVRGVQALHDRLPLRHDVLRRRYPEGLQVQPLRRRARLRLRVPDRRRSPSRTWRPPTGSATSPPSGAARTVLAAWTEPLMPARHLIVGGGTAGLNAIRTIREEERAGQDPSEITLVSAERPVLADGPAVLPRADHRRVATSTRRTPASLDGLEGEDPRWAARPTALDAASPDPHPRRRRPRSSSTTA